MPPATQHDRPDTERGCLDRHELDLVAWLVAWMATRDISEHTRRDHRRAVEDYLYWSQTDDGPDQDRRHRYEQHLARRYPERATTSRPALYCYRNYCTLRSRTLSVEEH